MKANQTRPIGWRHFASVAATLAASVLMASAITGCGDSSDGTSGTTVVAPDAPTGLTVVRTPETTLSATVTWSAAATGTVPDSFEIYRSTTSGTAFLPANHVISIPAVAGQATPYTFIDNAGLTPVDTYWAVSAKNAGGETASAEVMYKPIGPPGGTGDTGYGNNFASAIIFADNIGIGNAVITGAWTPPGVLFTTTPIDYNTGLRPLSNELADLTALTVPVIVTSLPYLDPNSAFLLGGVTYYKQQTPSIWQGEWALGASTQQVVSAKWGDNLISQSLSANSQIRVEMVLSKPLTTAMKSYTMKSLYGARENEIQGTDGTTYDNLTAFVFAANAHLKIEKLDAGGTPIVPPLYDQTLWMGDGPGFLAGEVNVSGNFTYGFVWNLKNQVMPDGVPKTGTWRLTFSLDPNSPAPNNAPNNTVIDTATNGVLDSSTQVHIDIVVQ